MPEEPNLDDFEKMSLKPDLLQGLKAYGFERPSAIQQRAIVPIAAGRDVIAQAQSGTGKTAMFAIAILQRIDTAMSCTQCLVLSPTRELARQTERVILAIGSRLNVTCRACIGGQSIGDDIRKLAFGVHVVSGTPGRVFDMIQRKTLSTRDLRLLVLDEADKMLSTGGTEPIADIHRCLPPDIQVVGVSTTLPNDVLEVTEKFMKAPVCRILVNRDELIADGVKQFFVAVENEHWKFDTLCDFYDSVMVRQACIFCNTKRRVDSLTTRLREANFTVTSVHGDFPEKERDDVMNEFRAGNTRVLITTDTWARGIDTTNVSLVINYDVPTTRENYLHRIGRTGRFGCKGVVINLATSEDIQLLRDIEQYYATIIDELPMSILEEFNREFS